jgi:hypothetical protein
LNFWLGRRDLQLREATDHRLEAEKERDDKRLEADNAATRSRLEVEAATKAVDLLTTNDGAAGTREQRAGALFILTGLGQYELALALLSEMWTDSGVSANAATWIVNHILRQPLTKSGAADDNRELAYLQIEAGQILAANVDQLMNEEPADSFVFPPCAIGEWPLSAHPYARSYVLEAYVRGMAKRSREEWRSFGVTNFRDQLELVREIETTESVGAAASVGIALVDQQPPSAADRQKCTDGDLLAALDLLESVWDGDGIERRADRDLGQRAGSSFGSAAMKPSKGSLASAHQDGEQDTPAMPDT